VGPTQAAVDHRDQGQKRDEHARDVKGQLQAIARAARRCVDQVHARLFHFHPHRTARDRIAGLGDEYFAEHDGGRGGHNDSSEQVHDGNIGDCDVSAHYRARHVGHAAGHYRKQLGFSKALEKRPDRYGRFRLAHRNTRGHASGFRAAGSHEALHENGHAFHEHLHNSQVVKSCEKRTDKNDDRQNLEREDHPELIAFQSEFVAEYKTRSGGGVVQYGVDKQAEGVERFLQRRLEHEKSERELQHDAPDHNSFLNGRALRGKKKRNQNDGNQADYAGVFCHRPPQLS